MLKAIRDNLKNFHWIIWILAGTFVLAIFAVWGGGTQGTGSPSSAIATVGKTEISELEFQVTYQRLEANVRSQWGDSFTPELARQLGLARQTLNSLVNRKLMLAEASRIGLTATASEIRDEILSIDYFKDTDGNFVGQEVYERALKSGAFGPRYTGPQFEAEIGRDLLLQKLNEVLGQTAFVTNDEIEEDYRNEVEKAKIRYLELPAARFANQVSVDEAETGRYYQQHIADYQLPERRKVGYVLIEPRLWRAEIEIEDADVRAYYDSHPDEFTLEERVRARHILLLASDSDLEAKRREIEDLRRRIENGEAFAALAREYSEDQETRDNGGELGLFARGRYNPTLEEAAFGGGEGDLIGPIETVLIGQTGVHLLEVQARQEGGLQPFVTVELGIRSRLLNERSRERAESEAQELSRRVRADDLGPDVLRSYASDQPAAVFETPEPFGRDDNVPLIGRATEFSTIAFALEPGEISQPVELPSGWALIHLEEVQDLRSATLEEVRTEVEQAARLEKQNAAAKERLDALLVELREGGVLEDGALEDAAATLDLEVTESDEFGRGGFVPGLGALAELSSSVFELAVDELGGPFQTPQGFVVFQVLERTLWDPIEFESKKADVRERLKDQRVNSLLQSIIDRRRNAEGVVANTDRMIALGVLDSDDGITGF